MSCRPRIKVAVRSESGRQRPNNEDRALVGFVAPFAVVCDVWAERRAGEIASNVAAEAIAAALDGGYPWANVEDTLFASVVAAGDRVRSLARAEPELARMGTTATVAAVHRNTLFCAQVGDSRAYLLRDGQLAQVTRDQTMVELLKASGVDVVGEGIPRNVILQAVGSSTRLEVVITRTQLRPGDVVLLCSDGLTDAVSDAVIETVLATHDDPEAACDELVTRANDAGGPDNITVVVLRHDLL